MKNILIACEESQEVTKAFRRRGLRAFSCDLEPCSGGHPEWHIQVDLEDNRMAEFDWDSDFGCSRFLVEQNWDLMIAFPPCTHLAVSGARWFAEKRADGRQQAAIRFFMQFANAPVPRVAIENPVGIMSTVWRKPDQIIQPWQFGHGETKKTCLWLKNLPPLEPTNIVDGREQRIWKMPPSEDRGRLRSKTYPGVAEAMAEQWGGLI